MNAPRREAEQHDAARTSTPRPGPSAAGTSTATGVHSTASPPARTAHARARRRRSASAASISSAQAPSRQAAPATAGRDHAAGALSSSAGRRREGAVELDRLAAHLVGLGRPRWREDRRREIHRTIRPRSFVLCELSRARPPSPADGRPQQFVAGRVGRALHDDHSSSRARARRSARAARSNRLRPRAGRPRPAACVLAGGDARGQRRRRAERQRRDPTAAVGRRIALQVAPWPGDARVAAAAGDLRGEQAGFRTCGRRCAPQRGRPAFDHGARAACSQRERGRMLGR